MNFILIQIRQVKKVTQWLLEHKQNYEQSNPIQSNVNKRAQVFLFARTFYNITFTYKLKHLQFQLTRNKNCKEHLDQASVCLDDILKVLSVSASTTESGKLFIY